MGLMPLTTSAERSTPPVGRTWRELVEAQVTRSMNELLELPDELRLGEHWAEALDLTRAHVLHPALGGHAVLLLSGYGLARGSTLVPGRLWRFAAGLELMHACRRLHESVRGAASGEKGLHTQLAPEPIGVHLAVVVGDHLFARALETMLGASLPGCVEATQYCLRLLRSSSVGPCLQEQEGALEQRGGMRQGTKLARLRVLHQGLPSALVCGAMLAGAGEELRLRLARVGCGMGLALQLREEVAALSGASTDLAWGRCSFPLVAAWSRALPGMKQELERLCSLPREQRDEAALARVRWLVEVSGGRSATERLAARSARGAMRALELLPEAQGLRELLRSLVEQLGRPDPADERTLGGEAL